MIFNEESVISFWLIIHHTGGKFMGVDRLGDEYLSQNTGFLIDPTKDDTTLEGWMMMNDIGMNW